MTPNYKDYLILPLVLNSLFITFLAQNEASLTDHATILAIALLSVTSVTPWLLYLCLKNINFIRASIYTATLTILFLSYQFDYTNQDLNYLLSSMTLLLFNMLLMIVSFLFFYKASNNSRNLFFIISLTLCLTSFFSPSTSFIKEKTFESHHQKNTKLPAYLHIILDEHVGFVGMPNQVATKVKNDYNSLGFDIYGQTYSKYYDTVRSFYNFFNFGLNPSNDYDKHYLTQNLYFNEIYNKGYSINVISNTYLDLCRTSKMMIHTCATFKSYSFDYENTFNPHLIKQSAYLIYISFKKYGLNNLIELIINLKNYFLTSTHIAHLAENKSSNTITNSVSDVNLSINKINSTFASKRVIDNYIIDKLSKSNQSEAYFIHLLIPHKPYMYDADCQVNRISLSDEEQHIAQLKCTHKLLSKIISTFNHANDNNTIIIVHGDHGSRNEYHDEDLFSENNKINLFNTFFMIKTPNSHGQYYENSVSLSTMMSELVHNDFEISNHISDDHIVYLKNDDNNKTTIVF